MIYKTFINYLLQFGDLNRQQIELVQSLLTTKQYKKEDFFLKAGQTSREIGFIIDGVFRVCYYDNEGNEFTRYFLDESNFIADINGFNSGIPSSEYIQAVTDGEVLILSKSAMEQLSQTIIVWDSIIGKITGRAMAEKVGRVSLMMPLEASARYELFLEKFPQIANRVPLQYIASYIGITKSSLSRLRRNLSKK